MGLPVVNLLFADGRLRSNISVAYEYIFGAAVWLVRVDGLKNYIIMTLSKGSLDWNTLRGLFIDYR